ncbi:pyridoxamine 5'-phosphate oxidase [Auriculariales sp. MPI-PUGE-AT-0066]|nr:pyridoxamine 5'-phosphate oxidase [Auriculariales sp. MPI-PUGE-AT-0066]
MDINPAAHALRVTSHDQYSTSGHLTPLNVAPSPLDQLRAWFTHALENGVREPEAMNLATSTASGVPSSRIVLLKQVDDHGLVFFTNYTSRKSTELSENPHAAVSLYWKEISRQVRVVGRVEKVDEKESDEYYATRPRGSRVGAWASPQSQSLREDELDTRVNEIEQKYDGQEDIPRPSFWGGWRIIPLEVEFWMGKPSRLHDRVQYLRENVNADWTIRRIAP